MVDPIDEKVLLVVIALAGQNSGLYDFDFIIFRLGDRKMICVFMRKTKDIRQ